MTKKLDRKIKVYNRTGGSLAYNIEALRTIRHWPKPGDYLNIGIDELIELKTVPGGMYILEHCVKIDDDEALKAIFDDRDVEPEYKYGVEEVDYLLYEGTLEQLLDALDYAPEGVLDLIKTRSKNKLPNTTAKVSAINEKFGFDLNKVVELAKSVAQDDEEKEEVVSARRATPVQTEKDKGRRTTPPVYKVVEKKD